MSSLGADDMVTYYYSWAEITAYLTRLKFQVCHEEITLNITPLHNGNFNPVNQAEIWPYDLP